jgi:hypothetical protein
MMDAHGLQDWKISVGNLRQHALHFKNGIGKGRWGECGYENKTIRIHHGVERRFRHVMLHEIAHALSLSSGTAQ